MARKMYTLSASGEDEVPLMSFFDEFGLKAEEIDLRKLRIVVDLDYSGVFYAGESPEHCVVILYEDPSS